MLQRDHAEDQVEGAVSEPAEVFERVVLVVDPVAVAVVVTGLDEHLGRDIHAGHVVEVPGERLADAADAAAKIERVAAVHRR